jgi:pimeloyl-ACP methyl ester carboxylesterase
MSSVIIVFLLLVCVFVVASVVLGRMTREVDSAHDGEYLELEGSWIRYYVTGGGPPVVLVHGWLSSSRVWEQLANRLAERFTVYALDLKGFGGSDKPLSGYGVRYGGRLLYAFCAHFGLTRAVVLGHDVGGAMAVKLAADHQEVVGRLVLVATPADENQIDLPTLLWLATLPLVGPVFYALGRFLRPLRRLWMRPFVRDPKDLREEAVEDSGRSTPTAVTKTLSVTRREISNGRLVRQAGIIKIPVLAIAGEEDQIVDPQATSDWARTLSAEVVLLNECGHLPMLERSGAFNAQVLAFLTGDHRYLEAADEPQEEEMVGEDEEAAVAETPEGSVSSAPATEPDPSTVTRKQEGGPPPRNRDLEYAERRDEASAPPVDQDADRVAEPQHKVDGPEERSQDHVNRGENEGVVGRPMPELPRDLFEWPRSLEELRPQDSSRGAERQVRDERGEDTDQQPEDPEKGPGS